VKPYLAVSLCSYSATAVLRESGFVQQVGLILVVDRPAVHVYLVPRLPERERMRIRIEPSTSVKAQYGT